MDYFLTQKILTSPHSIKYPHDTFWWEGIDGTRVLTHVPPFENYGSSGSPIEVKKCEERFKDKLTSPSTLLLVGQGDGGGAGAECLEAYERGKSIEGLSPMIYRTAEEFFNKISVKGDKYKTWKGLWIWICTQGHWLQLLTHKSTIK